MKAPRKKNTRNTGHIHKDTHITPLLWRHSLGVRWRVVGHTSSSTCAGFSTNSLFYGWCKRYAWKLCQVVHGRNGKGLSVVCSEKQHVTSNALQFFDLCCVFLVSNTRSTSETLRNTRNTSETLGNSRKHFRNTRKHFRNTRKHFRNIQKH